MAAHNKYGINDQQKRFLDIYRTDPELNASRAYAKAYPKTKSNSAARANASRLITSDNAQAYFTTKAREEDPDIGVKVTVERIIQELKHAAFFDPIDLFRDDYTLKPLSDLTEYVRRGIANVKIKRYGPKDKPTYEIIEIKLVGKERALELLGKHMQMFTEKFKIESEEAMYERVKAEIRADGEEAVSMLVANYERLKKINESGQEITRPTERPTEKPAELPADTTGNRDTSHLDDLI